MADVAPRPAEILPTTPMPISRNQADLQKPRSNLKLVTPRSVPPLQIDSNIRNAHVTLDVFSPVNHNGSYEFDRVIKAGAVLKRTRKTKSWKPIHIVLRPNLLSIYKDKEETKLRHQITLSELTAVARQKDPKRKAKHVFGLFSPSRNFHLSAESEQQAQEWVELIRSEARIDEEEEEMMITSPGGARTSYQGFERHMNRENLVSSSSENEPLQRTSTIVPADLHSARQQPHGLMSYSGNEQGSFSDFSDTAGTGHPRDSTWSLPHVSNTESTQADKEYPATRPSMARNASQISGLGAMPDEGRVVCQGWLHILKSKGGVRQWKHLWAVLRPRTLAMYKNEEEYSANLIIPFPNIINAVDIDPVSRTKRHCMQILTEERNYRFSAPDEDSLARWLGALKSLLAKRKEAALQRAAAVSASSGALSSLPVR
ncbi:hypothetical protein W97_09201 [Coniosporium apollinis CBS 100218]|uniref:PH domain-containing protein n=1 Tax=Coniosporium apollinis (strain CBS 100218) TaxID=1168221 RepID=R7Z7L2_CONA1|nr:uncharacterized protein W97_09201 [Coniosporium apollinis CBS 100218]EON69936.1 hypothetical protein W97_09201 [Coniosporium apollinis CBS 100218]